MEIYQFQFSKQAQKDITELTPRQKTKLQEILTEILSKNPYLGKALKGNLAGLRSSYSLPSVKLYLKRRRTHE